jgi:hypothetical protein
MMALAEISKVEEKAFGGGKPKSPFDLNALCEFNDWEEQVEQWKLGAEQLRGNSLAERFKKISFIRQMQYTYDPKRVFIWLIRDKTPMCEIDPVVLHSFFEDRWKKGEDLIMNRDFDLKSTMTDKMKEKFMNELMDSGKMSNLIRTRGNLSAPGLNELTNPIIKIERKVATETMLEVMQTLLNSGMCPALWKGARTILIYKAGDRNDPGNWRPITITSILYRIMFCIIADALHVVHEENGINICDKEQKGFIPKRAGCIEHTAETNAIINDAVRKKTPLYILSLDLRDAFGSVPHELIGKI